MTAHPKPPKKLTVKVCACGRVWAGGNSKYCDAGHAYKFTEHTYVLSAQSNQERR